MRPLRGLGAVVIAGLCWALSVPAPSVAQTAQPAQPAPPAVVIEGRGWGHGVGMAQDGALSMGRAGASTAAILSHFYPGTGLGRAAGPVRVEVLGDAGPATILEFPDGGEVRDGPTGSRSAGFPVAVAPGGRVDLSFDGTTYRARPLTGSGALGAVRPASAAATTPIVLLAAAPSPTTTPPTSTTVPAPRPPVRDPATPAATPAPPQAPAPATEPPPASPPPPPPDPSSTAGLWAVPSARSTVGVVARDRRYRGVVRAASGPGGLRLVNEVDVEDYLRGMGEVRDPTWPAASLGAQAIAARTYALRTVAGGGEICDTDQCQVYLGESAEYREMDGAVAATRGQVVTAGGGLALTVYSANAGGVSATPEEGFGSDNRGYPYLVASPYASTDLAAWTVQVDPVELGRRLGYEGELTGVRVARSGPSGRALEVSVEGTAGTMSVEGLRFMRDSGLRSNLFTLRIGPAEVVSAPVEQLARPSRALDPLTRQATGRGLARRTADPSRRLDRAPWEALVVAVVAFAVFRRRQTAEVPAAPR